MVGLFEPEFFQERFHFFFCQLAGTMKITIYMVIFRSKEEIQCNSGACT